MKKYLTIMAVVAAVAFSVTSCYDDSALQTSIAELQKQMKEVNGVLDNIKNGYVIKAVNPVEGGYVISMSDGSSFTVLNGKNGEDGTSASVIEAKLAELSVFAFSEKKDFDITVTGVEVIDAFAPLGWNAEVNDGVLTVSAPANSGAARNGRVLVVAAGGNSLVIMTVQVALNILDVNGAYWDALIDSPQYGGDLIYGPMDPETYTYNVTYTWEDPVTHLAFNGFVENWGSVCFSSGGEVISNYVEPDFKGAGYLRQLEVPVAPASGSNFIIHNGVSEIPALTFSDGKSRVIRSIDVIVTNYLANSCIYGDGYFGPLAEDGYVAVKALGFDAEGNNISEAVMVIISGADVATYLEGNAAFEWQTWDLTELGEVNSIGFTIIGSPDCYGDWGLNAPAYFAYCDVVVL